MQSPFVFLGPKSPSSGSAREVAVTIIFSPDMESIAIILYKYSHDIGKPKWGLPKGHINSGESYIKQLTQP